MTTASQKTETQEDLIARIAAEVLEHTREVTAKVVADAAMASAKAVLEEARARALVLSDAKETIAQDVALLKADVANLKLDYKAFEGAVRKKLDELEASVNCQFKELCNKIEVVLLGRPTWAVATVIGVLSATCTGLLVLIISHLLGTVGGG